MSKKVLIAYFSRGGENLINEEIVDIGREGNTAKAAKELKKQLEELGITSTLFEITPLESYPFFYSMVLDRAKDEKTKSSYPEILSGPVDFNQYQTIFLGYPNWWGSCPRTINSFLKEHDFASKTVIPFVTHGGQLFLYSLEEIKREIPMASLKEGFAIYANYMEQTPIIIENWLKENESFIK